MIPLIYRSPKRLPEINYFNLYIAQPWTDSSSFEVFLNSHCTKPSSFPYAKKWIENHNFSQWLWSQEKTHRPLQANLRPPAKSFNWVPLLLVPRITAALPALSASFPKECREGVWANNSLWRPEEKLTATCGWVEVPFETGEVENLWCALTKAKMKGERASHVGEATVITTKLFVLCFTQCYCKSNILMQTFQQPSSLAR